MKALEKDRGRRYETASKFAEDVERYLHDEPVTACPPSAAYRFRKFARRNKAALTMTAATAALLVLGIAGTGWQAIRATHERNRAVAAEAQAEQDAAIATAVNDFLQKDLLGMANAAEQAEALMSPDPDVKLRTLLDRAAEKIEERFADQPYVKAAICHAIGGAYKSIGEHQRAESLFLKALEIDCQTLGEEHPDTLKSMHSIGNVYIDQGRYDEAEAVMLKTVEFRRRTMGKEHPDTLISMEHLARIYDRQGDQQRAEKLYNDTLQILDRTLGESHLQTVRTLGNLGVLYARQGQHSKAKAIWERTLKTLRSTLGEEHPNTLACMMNLATAQKKLSQFEEAENLYRQTLEVQRRTLGVEHPSTLLTMVGLASVYEKQHRYKEALDLLLQTLEPLRRVLGEEHPVTLKVLTSLAWWLATAPDPAARNSAQAVELATRATEIQPGRANCWVNLGVALYRDGQFTEAVQILEKARRMGDGEDWYHRFFLAMAYWKTGQREKAVENYQQAVSWLESGDRGEEPRRFAEEARELIKSREAAREDPQETANRDADDE